MSPRVVPKERRSEDPAVVASLEAGWRAVRERELDVAIGDPYRAQYAPERTFTDASVPAHSFFRDLLVVAEADARAKRSHERALEQGGRGGSEASEQLPPPGFGDDTVEAARRRLAAAAKRDQAKLAELRDLTSASGSGGEFVPAGAAVYIAEAFAPAATRRGSLYAALPKRPLPEAGNKWEVPRFTTAAAVAVQAAENTAVQETDPATAIASSNLALLAGQVDTSRQLWDSARPGFDQALAADLGEALGQAVDAQLIAGTNASGQTQGLAQVSGTNAVTYTDVSPTPDEFVSKLWEGYRVIVEAGAGPPEPSPENYLIVMAPRRLAWLAADAGNAGGELPPLPGRPLPSTGVRLTLGAGTNEDEAFVIVRDEVFVSGDQPRFHVFESVGSSTLTVRFQAHLFLAAMFSRRPKAISRVSGTGMTAPTL